LTANCFASRSPGEGWPTSIQGQATENC